LRGHLVQKRKWKDVPIPIWQEQDHLEHAKVV
jgi:hypothetical protein